MIDLPEVGKSPERQEIMNMFNMLNITKGHEGKLV